jgi:hypothetical protein
MVCYSEKLLFKWLFWMTSSLFRWWIYHFSTPNLVVKLKQYFIPRCVEICQTTIDRFLYWLKSGFSKMGHTYLIRPRRQIGFYSDAIGDGLRWLIKQLILGKWPNWRTILFCVYFNSLHVSSNLVLIIRRINCITTTSGMCHPVSVTVWCAVCN